MAKRMGRLSPTILLRKTPTLADFLEQVLKIWAERAAATTIPERRC